MALSQTTTLRVRTELRDEISRLAKQRGTTMLDVVTDAVHRLDREEWWSSVRGALDGLSSAEATSYQAGSRELGAAAADGLDDR
jgi:predicted transcriptional regulator